MTPLSRRCLRLLEAKCLCDCDNNASHLPLETVFMTPWGEGLAGLALSSQEAPFPWLISGVDAWLLGQVQGSQWALPTQGFLGLRWASERLNHLAMLPSSFSQGTQAWCVFWDSLPSFFLCFCSFIQGSQVPPRSSRLGIQTHPQSWIVWPHLPV